jgi:hypothetical protein
MTENEIVIQNAFMAPVVSVSDALLAYQAKKDLIDKILKVGVDYGTVPGSTKPALLKPGAEKMTSLFGFAPRFIDAEIVEDWTGKDHNGEAFFFYRETCDLYRGERLVASAGGSCNSWEKKYRYRWVGEADIPTGMSKELLKARDGKISEFAFAVDKAETAGKYGKPPEYWQKFKDAIANNTAVSFKRKTSTGKEMDAWEIGAMLYCIQNDEISDLANTILKMAQKRALVASTLIATGLSEYFTQDIEDFVTGEVRDVTPEHKELMPYDVAAAKTVKHDGVDVRLDTLKKHELEIVVEKTKHVDIRDAAEIVLRHDYQMDLPSSD